MSEPVKQLGPLMVDVEGVSLTAEDQQVFSHPLVGGVILFTRNYQNKAQLLTLVREIKALRKPELIIAVDHEGGRVQRFRDGFTVLPPVANICTTESVDEESLHRARQHAWLMAAEVLACGIDISFAPVLDLDWKLSEVIGDRAFHQYPKAVSKLATAYIEGMHAAGMAATGKHFPGHGSVEADSHVALPVDRRPLEAIRVDISPYRALIDNGLEAVMMAHVIYNKLNRLPAGFSEYWIQQELRGRLEFDGVVFTDDLSMEAAAFVGDMQERVHLALHAGCDMALVCNNRPAVLKLLDGLSERVWQLHNSPEIQSRLQRLYAKPKFDVHQLEQLDEWHAARAITLELNENGKLA
ncbi:MAG: beta-N-acetylhexosaminidase [Gammaproteobacteria bacterium]|nr:beta-N-acetylhexosaminidase [Gammaproteobacteria bacterium]